jgi:alpha-ketoglutarate-dependent taurine dioxygenase
MRSARWRRRLDRPARPSVDEAAFREIFDAFQEHCWRQWDLVMWDNRCVLHRGRPWDATRHRRVMRRTTIAGEGPTAQPPLATRTAAWEGIVATGVGA